MLLCISLQRFFFRLHSQRLVEHPMTLLQRIVINHGANANRANRQYVGIILRVPKSTLDSPLNRFALLRDVG